jgi:hypothetical protein
VRDGTSGTPKALRHPARQPTVGPLASTALVTLALPALDDGAIDGITRQSWDEHVASFLG